MLRGADCRNLVFHVFSPVPHRASLVAVAKFDLHSQGKGFMTIAVRKSEAAEDTGAQRELARGLLERLSTLFDNAARHTAQLCARGGQLDPDLLDAHQGIEYELALANADLLAARTLMDLGGNISGLDAALGLIFATEAIPAVIERLDRIHIATELDSGALHAITADPGLRRLRHAAASPSILAAIGAAVADTAGEIADVALDEPTVLARDTFRRFAADVVAPLAQLIHREDLTVPETLLQPLREMGVFGLSIPETFGGSAPAGGDSTPMMIAVTEALSEASLAAAGSLITRPEILARALMAGGTEAQKANWLPRIAAGDPLCAIAITEPDHGSDVASLKLRGTRAEGGWLLNGAKTWCTFAGKAGVLMVVTRTNPDRSLGHRGLSLLLAEKPSYDGHEFSFRQQGGGTLTGRAIPTPGYRGMHSFDLSFVDFFVPNANVVGGEEGLGKGFYLTMAGMVGGRIQTAGRALGVMRAALTAAISYAKERRVFDAPLIDFPLTRIKLATLAARFAACRHLAYAIGRELDAGRGRMEASLVKLLACRSAEIVTREAMQIHGGMGYAEESPVSRYWADARVLSIFEGAEETLALKVVAKTLLESALKS
jgi:(2S)-methylsuccinyl-CoA dehydrogenase